MSWRGTIKTRKEDPRIGITTTIPIEIVFAAGYLPVDLNNLFVAHPKPNQLIDEAERKGYPRSFCAWIKGIYSVVKESDIPRVVGVTQGDCSNTHALIETLIDDGIEVFTFAYPFDRDKRTLAGELGKFAERLGTDLKEAQEWKGRLDEIRGQALKLDEENIEHQRINAGELNNLLLSTSDMMAGDLDEYRRVLDEVQKAGANTEEDSSSRSREIRLGIAGVPFIFTDLLEWLERRDGVRVVYLEIPRQFAMPAKSADLVEQYWHYTYPYGIFPRLADINGEIKRRRIDGLIHYVQGFCYRQVEDIILRRHLSIPMLTLEGDRPNALDAKSILRLETFLEMLN